MRCHGLPLPQIRRDEPVDELSHFVLDLLRGIADDVLLEALLDAAPVQQVHDPADPDRVVEVLVPPPLHLQQDAIEIRHPELEVALKIKETSGILADGYSSADFHHGPKALLEARIPVLVVAPGPRQFDDLDGIVALAREREAPLVAISDRPELLDAANVGLPLPANVPEWLSPLVAAIPGQLWALGLSLARGVQPDAPPGLSKVTHTR